MDRWQRDDERTRTFDLQRLRSAPAANAPTERPGPVLPRRIVEVAPPPSERDLRRR